MKALIALVGLMSIVLGQQEMWFIYDGTKFGFDRIFRKNLNEHAKRPNNSEEKKQLIEYFKFQRKAK